MQNRSRTRLTPRRWLLLMGCMLGPGGIASGSLYWDAWEGNNYPEQSFWHRTIQGGGAERTLVDGTLVLDGTASPDIADDYWKSGLPLPGTGEVFKALWRLRVDVVEYNPDPIVSILTPSPNGNVEIHYWEDKVYFPNEGWTWVPIQPGIFHEYALVSWDMMQTYKLYIDGSLAHEGQFLFYSDISGIAWGDGCTGAASASVWDYFRYGIVSACGPAPDGLTRVSEDVGATAVPEPSTWVTLGSAGLVVSLARIRKAAATRRAA